MKITISRTEIVVINSVKNVLEVTEFSNWADAFTYLEKQLGYELSEVHKLGFQQHPYTVTNAHQELINAGDSVYSGMVCYAVEVTK